MLDIVNRIKKIQLLSDIVASSNSKIIFPRFEKKVSRTDSAESFRFEGLDQCQVIFEIERARNDVISDLEALGVDSSNLNFYCQVQPVLERDIIDSTIDDDSNVESDSDLDSDLEDLDHSSRRTTDSASKNEEFYGEDTELDDLQNDLEILSGKIVQLTVLNSSFLLSSLRFRNNWSIIIKKLQ